MSAAMPPEARIPLPARPARGRLAHLVSIVPARGMQPTAQQRWVLSVLCADGQAITELRTGGAPMEHAADGVAMGGEGAVVRVVAMPEAA